MSYVQGRRQVVLALYKVIQSVLMDEIGSDFPEDEVKGSTSKRVRAH